MTIKKFLKSALPLVIAVSIFSGCTKYNVVAPVDKRNLVHMEAFSSFSDFGFVHARYGNSTYAIIQQAAEHTLSTGNKYFSVRDPAPLASHKGSLINTAKEYIKKCVPNMGGVFTGGLDVCKIHTRGRGWKADMRIALFKEEQKDFLVYNAQDVIDHLKSIDKFDTDMPEIKYKKFFSYDKNGVRK